MYGQGRQRLVFGADRLAGLGTSVARWILQSVFLSRTSVAARRSTRAKRRNIRRSSPRSSGLGPSGRRRFGSRVKGAFRAHVHIALIAGTLMDDNRPGLNPSLDYPGWQNFELAPAQHFTLQVTCDRDATGGYAGVYIGRFGDEKRPGAFNRAVYLAFNPEIIWS